VYLEVRSKRGLSVQQRVHKLLCGPLFQQLHKQVAAGGPNVFSKVRAVEGDMDLPGLGLSDADREELVREVQVVIHGAASLTLDAHIQDALRCGGWGLPRVVVAPAFCEVPRQLSAFVLGMSRAIRRWLQSACMCAHAHGFQSGLGCRKG
jgi:fatty acyl-CoA reductase